MAGLQNDYLIYPILQLIRDEVKKINVQNGTAQSDPFEGTPAVALYRRHPLDRDRVTGAMMQYESGYRVQIILTLGSNDPTTYPMSAMPGDLEWEYCELWRLSQVSATGFTPDNQPLITHIISLNYDDRGLLIGTTVDRI